MHRMYSEALMEHFEQPRHIGRLDPAATDVGTGVTGTRETGGVLQVQIRVVGDQIADVRFQAFGPPALIASGSWLAEAIRGSSLEQAGEITHQPIVAALSLPPARLHCAMLAEDAIKAAVHDYKDKQRAYA